MGRRTGIPRSTFAIDDMPLDAARAAFGWLLIGPRPLSIDGRSFRGLPDRKIPLDELRTLLLRRRCPQPVRDAVWAHLVERSRAEGGCWTVGCVGVALPALTSTASKLTARFASDPRDIHAAVLSGFLSELAVVNLSRPRIMLRLRWAAYRAGHTCLREALDAPTPSARAFHSSAPPPPSGHPDLVLLRAIKAGAITEAEAELIGTTRLEDVPLAEAAARRGSRYEAAKKARQRAESRLVAFLRDHPDTVHDTADNAGTGEAIRTSTTASGRSRTVTSVRLSETRRRRIRRHLGGVVSPQAAHDGVQVRGSDQTPPPQIDPPTEQHPSPDTRPHSRAAEAPDQPPRRTSNPNQGTPRCA
jgi:hypothetical protein